MWEGGDLVGGGVIAPNVFHDSYSFPPFFKHAICEAPLPMFYSSNETPRKRKRGIEKRKRRRKNLHSCDFSWIRYVGRDVLAFAATSG